jgi:hypothetical protein
VSSRVADAHRSDGKRFVVQADEKLTAFVELESGFAPSLHKIKANHRAVPAVGCIAWLGVGVLSRHK